MDAAPGVTWCRAWTALVDEALRGWLADAHEGEGLALVALGGYARRELCPASDVDLLLLHDGWGTKDLERLVQAICYPLWDAGLAVGHAVRTPRDAVRSAAERAETATALIDRRLVAGDRGLLDDLASRLTRWLRKASGRVLGDLAALDAARHAKSGDAPGMLELDLKNGVGGLRDLHSLRWASACVLGEVGLDPLVGARYLGAPDRAELAEAGDTLLAARCALHLVAGRGETLRLDLQDDVAARLGLPGGGDELLRSVGLAARTVAHLHGRTWPVLLADARGGRRRRKSAPQPVADGIALVDGLIEVEPGRTLRDEPSLGLRAMAAGAVREAHLGRATAVRLSHEVSQLGSLEWDAAGREALLAALRAGRRALAAFADADSIGMPEAMLPGWDRIRGLPQRNPLHRYDVDTHLMHAFAELMAVAEGALDPAHQKVWADLADQDALLLGTWLHDVGKGLPGDHSEAGERLARTWLAHMGFGAERIDHVGRLVRHHLLLPDVATRRDLDDEDEILRVARIAGDVEMLDGLYLLSLADSRATGPAAWSPWKDRLLADLWSRVRRVLVDDLEALRRDMSVSRVLIDAAEIVGPTAGLDTLVDALPPRYLLTASPRQVAEHARLLLPLPSPGELRASWRRGLADGTAVVSVIAGDRRGLMADCAGVLAGHGLGVLDARAFTRPDDVALDWFVVRVPHDVDWERVIEDLRAAAAGDLDVGALVARRERRRDERPPALAAPIPLEVSIDDDRVEVRGPDGVGVLYRLARVLADAGLDVVGARVDTLGPQVHDVFFTRGCAPEDLVWSIRAIYGADAAPSD